MLMMANRTFLASHAQALLRIAHDPEVRLRDIAASRGITEPSAYRTVTDPAEADFAVKQKNRRRNRGQTRAHLPAAGTRQPRAHRRRRPGPSRRHRSRSRNSGPPDPTDDLGRFPQLAWLIEGVSFHPQAAAQAEDASDLSGRLEACGQLVRPDPAAEPAMYRCATMSQAELRSLRRIENVVRLGRVVHIAEDRIVLEEGSIPADGSQVHVDCSAAGLRLAPGRPAFDAGRITLQQIRACQPAFNAALVGYVEATRHDDAEKNRLCPPNPYPDTAMDWISTTCIAQRAQALWLADTDLSAWMEGARLNAARGIGDHLADPRMTSALTRMFANAESAVAKLETLQAEAQQAGRATRRPY